MKLKNLRLYRVHGPLMLSAANFNEALQERLTRPLGGCESKRLGWTPPFDGELLCREVKDHYLFRAHRQERMLPKAVIAKKVEADAKAFEESEGRRPNKQEEQVLKEAAYEQLLPQAFIRDQLSYVWWSVSSSVIAVQSTSNKAAEEILDLLRECLGSLKVTPLATHNLPSQVMTDWLRLPGSRPEWMLLGDTVALKQQGGGKITARNEDLDQDDIHQLVESGRQVEKLDLEVNGLASLSLKTDLSISKLRIDDEVIEERQVDEIEDPDARLEADFLLYADTLLKVLQLITEQMGGAVQGEHQKEAS